MATTTPTRNTTKSVGRTYRVRFERDESGWWTASVPAVKGCHTQGRTLGEARRRIREALGLFVEDADTAEFVDEVRMPAAALLAVRKYRTLRAEAERVQNETRARAEHAVRLLSGPKLKLSRRDTAEVLGVSPQRIQQLLKT